MTRPFEDRPTALGSRAPWRWLRGLRASRAVAALGALVPTERLRALVPAMRLRTRLTLVFCTGTVAMLALAVLLQSALLTRHVRVQAESSARAACKELGESIARRIDELSVLAGAARTAGEHRDHAAALASLPVVADSGTYGFVIARGGAVLWRSSSAASAPPALVSWIGTSPLVSPSGRSKARDGVMPSPIGPLVGASAPFGQGGAEFVCVRALELVETRQEGVPVTLAVWPAVEALMPEEARPLLQSILREPAPVEHEVAGRFASYVGLRDPDGRVALVARAEALRADLSLQHAWLVETAWWMTAIALVGLLLLHRFLDQAVLSPLRVLQQHAARIGRSDHGRVEIRLDRADEFGDLARALDGMLRSLDQARQEVVRSARYAGMSDVSKGVVHSIGNVLNSVNVSTHLLVQQFERAGVGDMRLLIDELKRHQDDLGRYVAEDPNGKHLLPFLDAMTSSFEDLQTRSMVELEAMEKGIDHVLQLLRSMERYASGATYAEEFEVLAVVEMAIEIACLAHGGARDVEIVREFRAVPNATLDKHKLTTILIHIVSNALDALAASPLAHRRLDVAVYPAGEERFVIEITDTGMGIPPENLDSIFSSGFTTKDGATGEGLHTSANLCRELGISIGAMSEGVGTGATFKLRVPYKCEAPAPKSVEPPPILPTISGGSVQFDRRKTNRTA